MLQVWSACSTPLIFTMFEKLIAVFENLNAPYYREGTFQSNDEYPIAFYTFWNGETDAGHWDNEEQKIVWKFQVKFFTSKPEHLYSGLNQFIAAAKDAGFIISGKGYDIPCDIPNHAGRVVDVTYVQYL